MCYFRYWVATADLLLSTTFSMTLTWRDETGNLRTIPGGPVVLATGGAMFRSAMHIIERQSATSEVTFDRSILLGLAGNARISYRLFLEEIQYPSDW